MKFTKSLLYRLLGRRNYLLFVSRSFIVLYRLGILRTSGRFSAHYMARKLVIKGDTVIDVGANMGYFSTIFAKKAGKSGKVICIEPVESFREILEKNTSKFENIEILPFALGDYNGKVRMGIPGNDKTRHGLTRIATGNEDIADTWEAEIRKTDELLKDIVTVNYIKIDIEGFEDRVLPGFASIINSNRPIIQIEVDQKNYNAINGLLEKYGYSPYSVINRKLVKSNKDNSTGSDTFFLTKDLSLKFRNIIAFQ